MTDPGKPLGGGALDGTKTGRFYGEPHGQYVAALKAAGGVQGIDFSVPYESLGAEARRIAMFGTGDRTYDVVWAYKRKNRAGEFRFKGPWKGFANLVTEEYERKHADDRGEAMLPLMKEEPCPACGGARLKPSSLAVKFAGMNIAELSALTVREAFSFFEGAGLLEGMGERATAVTEALRAEILRRLSLVRDAGLDYLAIDRRSATLSGGEAGRLRLAGQLGARLSGVTYVLDEPTIGLHPRDTSRLVAMLKDMTGRRNTVVVVEHDIDVIRAADRLIDMGPGAGADGGRIVAEGSPEEVAADPSSPTGRFLARGFPAPAPLPGTPLPGIRITGASANNLRAIDVDIPSGVLTAVTGVSGSGKSSLVFDVLTESSRAGRPVGCRDIGGFERFERVIHVDQEPLDGGPRSIPGDVHRSVRCDPSLVRRHGRSQGARFRQVPFLLPHQGRPLRGLRRGREDLVSMDFLADVETICEDCGGMRYKPEVLEVKLDGKTVADVLDMTTSEARAFFAGRHGLGGAACPVRRDRLGLSEAGPAARYALGRRGPAPEARDRPGPSRPKGSASTSSTSRRPAFISRISRSCSRSSRVCSTRGTPSSSSSTTWISSPGRTMSSISAPKEATRAAGSWRPDLPRISPPARAHIPAPRSAELSP